MPEPRQDTPTSGINIQDILYVVFKHKWKILFFTFAGLAAAATVYLTRVPLYESDAKLLVRYVVERTPVDPADNPNGNGRNPDNNIGAEVEILTSWDLSMQVAEAVGIDQLAPGVKNHASAELAAAQAVQTGMAVAAPQRNVIAVSYKNENPALATNVLQELLKRYFIKHLEVHRSEAAFDFITQQTDQIRARLTQTEEELKRLKDKVGVVSLADSTNAVSLEMSRAQGALKTSETERAEQIARMTEIEKFFSVVAGKAASDDKTAAPPPKPAGNAETQEYQALINRLNLLRQTELDILSKYTPENRQVQLVHSQITDLEGKRATLASKFPDLVAKTSGAPLAQQGPDLLGERTRLAAIDARIASLKDQLQTAQQRADQLASAAPQIIQLDRQRELEETNYRYFAASLEKARVDEALDPSKIPNISVVQKPSVGWRTTSDLRKTITQLAGGGLGLGLGLAFLIEMVLDRTIKRSSEFERRLHIPLLVSIPYLKNKLSLRLPQTPALSNGEGEKSVQIARQKKLAPWEPGHFVRPYAEAIRDRLGLYFELNNLTHKPKLVAVTGFSEGGGTSTIAGGIAAALSEMGEGKVLLVDMNVGHPEVHPFFEGKPAYSLMTALHPACPIAAAAENLYLATPFSIEDSKQMQLGPKRIYELMPMLKASNFDYIIFDMPSLDQSSVVVSMAGLMDKVLLVTEAENCGANMVRRAYKELTTARNNVACVLNKTRTYGPKLIKAES